MTPAARIAAVVDILDVVAQGRRPADEVLRDYLRGRRYIGSKDRRAIAGDLYAILRRIVAIDYRLGDSALTARLRAACWLAERGDPAAFFTGAGYAAPPLDETEIAVLRTARTALPDWAEANLPEWLVPAFTHRFGTAWIEHAAALNGPATVDLRVNRLKTNRDQALEALTIEGMTAEPTPYSPDGVRLESRFVPGNLKMFTDGWVEPQDEASQLVALSTGAQPGMTVIDLCAGAGGKTLALAAMMADQGRLIACDVDAARLARLTPRAVRAGISIDELIVVGEQAVPEALAGLADRVLVDAPCSGTGTWRRQPDARLRLQPDQVEAVCALQAQLLKQAVAMTKPGGLVVYAVCSVLAAEGPDQIAAACSAIPGIEPVPPAALLPGTPLPEGCRDGGLGLTFTPLTTRTDGFFVAALQVQAH